MADLKTVNVFGAELAVDPAALEDIEFAEAIADMVTADDEGNAAAALAAATRYFRLLFGSQYKAAKQAIRDANDGRCTVADMNAAATAAMEQLGAKN